MASRIEIKENNLNKIWQEYKDGKNYLRSMGLDTTIPMCVDFYEGRHWGKISEKTKALPRPIFNQIEMIVDSKGAGILATPLKVIFSSHEVPELADKLTEFNRQMEKEMKLEDIWATVVNQAQVEGSSFLHFYWDGDVVSKRGEFSGGVRAEIIDPLNVLVHNPRETDIQKQKWIIVESRCEVDAVRQMCRNSVDRLKIVPDDNENYLAGNEQDNSKLVTILTKYFRINGEVYFEKVTKNAVVCEATPLNPDLNIYNKMLGEKFSSGRDVGNVADGYNNGNFAGGENKVKEKVAENGIDVSLLSLPDEPQSDEQYIYKATLYPIEVYQYKRRKNCIYGRGEVEPIIPNNRVVNFNTAMMAKGVEDQGFGQIVAKEGAMAKGDKFTNDPTRILIDRYKGGVGFYSLEKQPFNPQTYQLNKEILETTRSVTGATQVMTGELIGKNQSGTSIAYLQEQAQKPLENLAKRFRKFRLRCAEVLLQFYVLFYENKEFYNDGVREVLGGSVIDGISHNRNIMAKDNKIMSNTYSVGGKNRDLFKGSEIRGFDFDISIDIGAGTQYSELVTVEILDNLLNTNKIDLKTYYKVYPETLLPNKQELLKSLEMQEESKVVNLERLLDSQNERLKEYEERTKYLNGIVDNIMNTINENKRLKEVLASYQKSDI